MFFLFRMAFWLCVILVLLPTFAGSDGKPVAADDTNVSATEAVTAASATVADMRHFCSRQPDACTIGAQAAVAIGHKAQAGAKILYDFINEKHGPRATGSLPAAQTPRAGHKSAHGTLTPADLAVPWRGARPKEAASRRST